jgi:hypothetical protein
MEIFMLRFGWTALAPLILLGLSACSSGMQSQSAADQSMQSNATSNRAGYRQTLQNHGYTQISDPQQSGQSQVGNAVDAGGQVVQFAIDPDGGVLVHIQ